MFLRPLHFIPSDTKIDFVAKRWWAFSMTIFLVVVTAWSLAVNGLNLGIDFKGGIQIVAKDKAQHAVDDAALRAQLGALNLGEIELQQYGTPDVVMIRVQMQGDGEKAAQDKAVDSVKQKMGDGYEYSVDVVGPTVGKELLHAGILATVLAMLAISAYVAIRFEWQFGVAALISTFHDVLTTVGLYSVLHLDFNLTAVAALLTLAGYSINDTVVVFDRIRETLRRQKSPSLRAVINDSVNQTLSRTTMTAGCTLLALLPLVFMGGQTLINFSLALTWGIVVGTYSSIYVAAALLLYMPPLRRIDPALKPSKA
jgi:preprotein translocase SecF subunit